MKLTPSKIISTLMLVSLFFTWGCSLDKVDPVKLLQELKFEWVSSETEVEFLDGAFVVGTDNDFNVNKLDYNIAKFFEQIKSGKFAPGLSKVTVIGNVKITNPHKTDIKAVKIISEVLMDEKKVADITHEKEVVIPAEGEAFTDLKIVFPNNLTLDDFDKAKKIKLKAVVTFSLELLGTRYEKDIPVEIETDFPRKQIVSAVDSQKDFLLKKVTDFVNSIKDKIDLNNVLDKLF